MKHYFSILLSRRVRVPDIIGDGSLLVDVHVTVPDGWSMNAVELLTTELVFEINTVEMSWTDAEAYYVSKVCRVQGIL